MSINSSDLLQIVFAAAAGIITSIITGIFTRVIANRKSARIEKANDELLKVLLGITYETEAALWSRFSSLRGHLLKKYRLRKNNLISWEEMRGMCSPTKYKSDNYSFSGLIDLNSINQKGNRSTLVSAVTSSRIDESIKYAERWLTVALVSVVNILQHLFTLTLIFGLVFSFFYISTALLLSIRHHR